MRVLLAEPNAPVSDAAANTLSEPVKAGAAVGVPVEAPDAGGAPALDGEADEHAVTAKLSAASDGMIRPGR